VANTRTPDNAIANSRKPDVHACEGSRSARKAYVRASTNHIGPAAMVATSARLLDDVAAGYMISP
jgi:hypothetical protein